jgi:hypothetical protein
MTRIWNRLWSMRIIIDESFQFTVFGFQFSVKDQLLLAEKLKEGLVG